MKTCWRGGLVWRRGIGGWYTRVGGTPYRVERHDGPEFPWWLWRSSVHEYSGRTFRDVAQQLVSDLCLFDHEQHGPDCGIEVMTEAAFHSKAKGE